MEFVWKICDTRRLSAVHRWELGTSSQRHGVVALEQQRSNLVKTPRDISWLRLREGLYPTVEVGGAITNSWLEDSPAQNGPTTLEEPSP